MAATNPVTMTVRNRAKKLQKDERVSPLNAEACAGFDELLQATATAESHEGVHTIRTRKLELKPRESGPDEVRAVRTKLKASQALLARFMGVNTQTVSYWEQGRRKVPPMARRYLDDLVDFPALWTARTGSSVKVK